jgi:UDP-N-acetylmuramyl pentapeptide phosphotransferase/UDP-N-acetylglucosamine-1-phosphate transferase
MSDAAIFIALPAIVSAVVIALAGRTRWSARFADHPNERSLHSHAVPRLGGIGVMVASIPMLALAGSGALSVIAACALFLALVSLADDARSLPIEVRLPAHAVAALVAVLAAGDPAWGWPIAIGAVFAIVWMTNLFNFMDGSDGLAGGMALIGFGTLALAANGSGSPALALGCAAIAAAAGGFLLHNFPPARVFLGDAGSVPLGFLAGALGALGIANGAWPWWFPALVFSPFIVDATVTILRRALRGERIWIAHRSHFYQRLVLAGWSRRRLAIASYALMALAAASALVAHRSGEAARYAIILFWSAMYPMVLVAIERRTRQTGADSR